MLESLLNYPVLTTGLVMAPRGVASMIGMILVGKLIQKISPRWLIVSGILLCAMGLHFCTKYSHNIDMWWIIWPQLLQGFGLGLIFVPLSVVAFSTLSSNVRAEAAGLYNLLRTLGSSIGIAITITIFTRHSQIAWNQLSGFINLYNPAAFQYLHPLNLLPHDPKAIAILATEVQNQSQTLAIINVFAFIMWSFLAMLPLACSIKYKHPVAEINDILD
jgi:DHA2 family multidrug resistance protein